MSLPRQLSPTARLLRILFDRLILHPAYHKLHRPEPPRTGSGDSRTLPIDDDLAFRHHLLRDGFQNLMIEHAAKPQFELLVILCTLAVYQRCTHKRRVSHFSRVWENWGF